MPPFENYTRCPGCLRLTYQDGRCTRTDCAQESAGGRKLEERAARLLATAGYRIVDRDVYYVSHEDPEGWWDGALVQTAWTDTLAELYAALLAHDWPRSDRSIICPECKNADVAELGDFCLACDRALASGRI